MERVLIDSEVEVAQDEAQLVEIKRKSHLLKQKYFGQVEACDLPSTDYL